MVVLSAFVPLGLLPFLASGTSSTWELQPSAILIVFTTPSAALVWAGGGAIVPSGVAIPPVALLACWLEILGVYWNSAFTGGALGELLFWICFVLGEVTSGLSFLSESGGVFGSTGLTHVNFFSSGSMFISSGPKSGF